jgi:DNA-binding NarL/FixJ family response regulator
MSPSLSPPQPPDPSSSARRQQQGATSKPLATPLGHVGVAVVDDDENVHLLVRDILDRAQEFCWVGSYSSGEAALTGIPQSGAQVVLMDIRMHGMSGIECARRLKALLPHLVVVMVTGVDDRRTINLTRECGADAFLAKPFTAGQFLATLSFCAPGPKVEPSERQSGRKGRLRGRSLTTRESKLMEYLAEGLLYKEIADRTGVSESAVHHMLSRIFKKLGVTNKVEAIRKWKNGNRP